MFRIAVLLLSFLALLPARTAFAQAADTPFQEALITNDLTKGDALVALSNSGASSFTPTNGQICVNVYAMSGNGAAPSPVSACCTCKMQPNGFASLSVNNEILAGVSPRPRNVAIKVMGTVGTGACSAGSPGALTTGMLAWQNTPQGPLTGSPGTPTIPFIPSTLSALELNRLISQCGALTARTCSAACAP